MPISASLMRKLEPLEPQLRDALLTILEEIERQREEAVTKREFDELIIVGEAKAQLSKGGVSEFLRKKLRPLEGVFRAEVFPILVTHMITQPDVEQYASKQGIKRIYS